MVTTDLDRSIDGSKRADQMYLGPTLGMTDAPQNILRVTTGGTTTIDRNITLVEVNFAGAVTIQLPTTVNVEPNLGTLIREPVTIVDISGAASTNHITILPFGSELIIGLASIEIYTNWGSYTINPMETGGWTLIDQNPSNIGQITFETRSAVQVTMIPVLTTGIITLGYSASGDLGGGVYKKVALEPTHAGKVQSADGAWWELSEQVLNAKMFGAVGDGVADDTTALQNAIDMASAANGQRILLSESGHLISSTLIISNGNVSLIGQGGAPIPGSPVYTGSYRTLSATYIVWGGANGGIMVHYITPAAAEHPIWGGTVSNITFISDSNASPGTGTNIAATGIKLTSVRGMFLTDLFFVEFSDAGILTTTRELVNAVNNDTQGNYFTSIRGEQYYQSGDLMRLTADSSFYGGPSWNGNSSLNWIDGLDCFINNGNLLVFGSSDNNTADHLRAFNIGGTGRSVVFNGVDGPADIFIAAHNTVRCLSTNAAAIGKGTTSFVYPSLNNQVLQLDKGNGTPDPVIETGSSIFYTDNRNIDYYKKLANVGIGDSAFGALQAYNGVNGSTCSAYIYNGSADHIRLDNAGGSIWSITIVGTQLRLVALAGGGTEVTVPNLLSSDRIESVNQIKTGAYPGSSFPSAVTAGAGARLFLTDSFTNTWGAIAAGGGAFAVPVYSDGTNWRVG